MPDACCAIAATCAQPHLLSSAPTSAPCASPILTPAHADDAYGFLLSVAEGGGGLASTLLSAMWPTHATAGEASAWRNAFDVREQSIRRAAAGYVGLHNLGYNLRQLQPSPTFSNLLQPPPTVSNRLQHSPTFSSRLLTPSHAFSQVHVLHGGPHAAALHVPSPRRRPPRRRRCQRG